MTLMPKRVKYRKQQRGRRKGIATRGSRLNFGDYGLKSLENGWIKSIHIEAARVIIMRQLQGGGKLWIRMFPDKSVTKKPAETRHGKGKGDLDHWVVNVRRGKVLLELGGVPQELTKQAFRLAAFKFPLRTKFVTRIHV